ncbi:hypothetical protein BJ508DRAFT_308218 [Ascobolus immersus RN42]|uniref:F-box domain-containing protein n=1 Tax=Ascobolus immersus RN42 TaxID=1160509 RepID=A0A3N4I2D6_ASCIM|nr:hypothetical protein BJ508DRAFT_308218 [Ascobolus immersus RN42]
MATTQTPNAARAGLLGLPNEILHAIALLCTSPRDYHALGLINKHLYSVTHTPYTITTFITSYIKSQHTGSEFSHSTHNLEFLYRFIRERSNELLRLEREQGYAHHYTTKPKTNIITGHHASHHGANPNYIMFQEAHPKKWNKWETYTLRMTWSASEAWRLRNFFALEGTKPEQSESLCIAVNTEPRAELYQVMGDGPEEEPLDEPVFHYMSWSSRWITLDIRQEWLRSYHRAREYRWGSDSYAGVGLEDAVLVERLQECWMRHASDPYDKEYLVNCTGEVAILDYVGEFVSAAYV